LKTSSFVSKLATATIFTRCFMRQVECLKQLSECYWVVGDRSRATTYATNALALVGFHVNGQSTHKLSLAEFICQSRSEPFRNSQDIQCLMFRMKARSTSWDQLSSEFRREFKLCSASRTAPSILSCALNQDLEEMFNTESGKCAVI
jgi:hypothetical protein